MPIHASSLAPAARARRNHEIMRPFDYRLDEPNHHFRVVAAIAVEEHDDVAISRERAQSCAKRPSVSALGLCYHASARGGCRFRTAIGTAVTDDGYFISEISVQTSG